MDNSKAIPDELAREIQRLAHAALEGSAGDEELMQLDEIVCSDPTAAAYFARTVETSQLLGDWAASRPSAPEAALARPLRQPVPGFLHKVRKRVKRYSYDLRFQIGLVWISTILFAGVVAGVVAAITVMWRGANLPGDQQIADQGPGQPSVPSAPVARLNRVVDCVWSADVNSPSVGDDLMPGRKLVLKAGLAEVVFENGAQAILQGPATLEVRSRNGATLHRGKVTVTVENPAARGFAIDTRGMKYTDLGTEFGVLVAQSGLQEVHVFRGEVKAEVAIKKASTSFPSRPVAAPPALLVTAHQAIRVAAPDASGNPTKPVELITADDKQFVRTAEMETMAEQQLAFRRWQQSSDELSKRPDLAAYYDFQPDENDRAVLRNRAASGAQLDGSLVDGATWCEGRMPGKQAIEFRQGKSGVRVKLEEVLPEATFAAWICLDDSATFGNHAWSRGSDMNLLASDRWNTRAGMMHWRIHRGGTLSMAVNDKSVVNDSQKGISSGADSSVVYPAAGWHFLAATYSASTGRLVHYFDGRKVGSCEIACNEVSLGDATIGNWNHLGTLPADERPLRGRMDELMIFRAALTADAIKQLYEANRGN